MSDPGVPGKDYRLMLNGAYSDYWTIAHMRVRTDAEQPKGVSAPEGWQDFNCCIEIPSPGVRSYYAMSREESKNKAIREIQYMYEWSATYWNAKGIPFELPRRLWIMTNEYPEPKQVSIDFPEVSDGPF